MIRYPNIIGKTDSQKLEQMKSYLHQLADELNFQLDKTGNLMSGYASTANDTANAAKPVKRDDPISNFNDIKALIIKSADIVNAYAKEIVKIIDQSGQYVAESDFGTFKETTEAQLTASSAKIEAVVTKQEEINSDMDDLERTLRSEIEQTAESISMTVENGDSTAQIVLKVGDKEIPATIDMKGLVTFQNLANENDTTVINGSNIKTGSISADLIKTGTLAADVVKLTEAGVESYTFNSLDELNAFVESAADVMKPNTQRTIGAVLNGVTIGSRDMNSYGVITISVGTDSDGFKYSVATLISVDDISSPVFAQRDGTSEGDGGTGHETLYWGLWEFVTNTMFVGFDGDWATRTSLEIYNHAQRSGNVVLYAENKCWNLMDVSEDEAVFTHFGEAGFMRSHVIYKDGSHDSFEGVFADKSFTEKRNVATYNTFPQLGLTASCTISEVFKAMPAPAIFIFSHSKGSPYVVTDSPHDYCIIEVVKSSTNFGVARAINVSTSTAVPYTGSLYYDAANSTVVFSGWHQETSHMKCVWSGNLTSTNSATFAYDKNYSAYLIIARPANSSSAGRMSVTVPAELITTTSSLWQVADETTYATFTLTRSGSTVTMTKTNSKGLIEYVYGIR